MARYPSCRNAGRACNNICGTSFSSTATSWPSSATWKTPGTASAPSRAIVVSPPSQKSISSCSASSTSFQCCRSMPGCVETSVSSHQRPLDVVVIVAATCPHYHLIVAAIGKFRVSQRRMTLDHCWQWRPQFTFQLLKIEFPPCHVGHESGFHVDVFLDFEKCLLDLRRFVLVLGDLPASVQLSRDQVYTVILYQCVVPRPRSSFRL